MFERRTQVSVISREVNRLLTHKGWKQFKSFWDRHSIERFLTDRAREERSNPFLRPARFDPHLETYTFLMKVLQAFVDKYARDPYHFNVRYIHAANQLAQEMGVPVPPPTPQEIPDYLFPAWSGWPDPDEPAFPAPSPAPQIHHVPTAHGAASAAPRLAPPGTTQRPPPPPPPEPEPSDDKKMAALQALMTHPSTPEHERRAALEAYMRLLNKRKG